MLWWDAHRGAWKPKTEDGYRKVLAVLDPHFGNLTWQAIDKPRLQQFVAERRKQGASIATINRNLSVVSAIANTVRHLDGWPDTNPVNSLPRRQRREKRLPFIRPTADCIERVFAHMHGTFGDLCRFALLTGMRRDEIVFLERRHCLDGEVQIVDQKNPRAASVIPIGAEAQAIISRQPRHPSSPYLFVTRNGTHYKRVTEMWREVVARTQKLTQKEGVPFTPFRFHDLRHEFAIRYLKAGGSLYALQKILRHSTIGQTEWYLSFLTPDQAEQAQQ